MRTNKTKGTEFERRVVNHLKNKGFWAIRQGSSRFPDIVAIKKDGTVFFIECKMNKYISREERSKLMELQEQYKGTPFIAYQERRPKGSWIHFCDPTYNQTQELEKSI